MKISELLESLSDEQVQYVLVGGLAVQLHGFLRSTFDIDLVLAMDDANLVRFITVAKRLGLIPAIPVAIESLRNDKQIEQWYREKGMLAFALREPQVGGSMNANAIVGEFSGRKVRIASIADLLAMKRVSNRPKDQLDIVALEKIMRGEDPNA
jgi:hypothetical protein